MNEVDISVLQVEQCFFRLCLGYKEGLFQMGHLQFWVPFPEKPVRELVFEREPFCWKALNPFTVFFPFIFTMYFSWSWQTAWHYFWRAVCRKRFAVPWKQELQVDQKFTWFHSWKQVVAWGYTCRAKMWNDIVNDIWYWGKGFIYNRVVKQFSPHEICRWLRLAPLESILGRIHFAADQRGNYMLAIWIWEASLLDLARIPLPFANGVWTIRYLRLRISCVLCWRQELCMHTGDPGDTFIINNHVDHNEIICFIYQTQGTSMDK